MSFRDREDAARRLAAELRDYEGEEPLVLAIPRGAVPMGAILADALGGELDVALVHKLGAPLHPECAIGAVAESGEVVMSDAPDVAAVPRVYVERETASRRRRRSSRSAGSSTTSARSATTRWSRSCARTRGGAR